jgi:hypothetical protein
MTAYGLLGWDLCVLKIFTIFGGIDLLQYREGQGDWLQTIEKTETFETVQRRERVVY